MGLFKYLHLENAPGIDWEMTPEYTFGTFESWGGKERLRNNNELFYYFFIDGWGETPKLCLMERAVKHARILAEILAPEDMVRRCVQDQGKVAHFERTFAINQELKDWLIKNVIESDDDSLVLPLQEEEKPEIVDSGLPKRGEVSAPVTRVWLPEDFRELDEADVAEAVNRYNFPDQERNPGGFFPHLLVDNGDRQTVSDMTTGLMWQRTGLDIMSFRLLKIAVERLNREGFAGFHDWRIPSFEEAMSLLEKDRLANEQYLHRCFSPQQAFVFVNSPRKRGGYWFVDYKQGRAYWASGTIPGGFGRLCRTDEALRR